MTAQPRKRRGTIRTNKQKRLAVISMLNHLDENGEFWSNRKLAAECRVTEGLVRKVKKNLALTTNSTKCLGLDGRVLETANIGSQTRHHKEKKAEQKRKAKTKKERLEGIEQEEDLIIERCPICKSIYIKEEREL